MKIKFSFFAILLVAIIVIACKKNDLEATTNEKYSDTPVLPDMPYDYSNSTNDNLATLGRVLFYDKSLSLNNSVACASCHQQSKAFCDNLKFSVGLEDNTTARNSPSIFAKSGRMFWDGRASSLNDLVSAPIKNHIEMKFDNLSELAKKISKINYYPELFTKAFGSAYIDSSRIKQALANFISNFNFSDNRFARSNTNQASLNASESVGKNIFFGKGHCSGCHHVDGNNSFGNGYGFTDLDFNIGLDKVYTDNGLGAVTNNATDNGKFMVPVLLNVELTAPYMHDGRFKTLEQVVEHYNSGVNDHPNLSVELRETDDLETMSENQLLALLDKNHNGIIDESELATIPVRKLNLSQSEKNSLVDFLKTLTDRAILTDVKFKTPFIK